jgi:hypothetical protein
LSVSVIELALVLGLDALVLGLDALIVEGLSVSAGVPELDPWDGLGSPSSLGQAVVTTHRAVKANNSCGLIRAESRQHAVRSLDRRAETSENSPSPRRVALFGLSANHDRGR